MGGSVPLPEILAEAAKRLDGKLDAVPDVRAELLLAIGETYAKLQRDDDAAPHLRAAVEQARRAGDPLLVARALVPLGTVLNERDEAKALLEEAVAIRERELGARQALTAQARSALSLTLHERYHDPEPERAVAMQRAALADLLAASGERDPEVVRARLRLGRMLGERRDDRAADGESDQQLRAAIERVDDVAETDPGLATECLHTYASFLQVRGRFDEAHALLERGLAITRARFGDEQEPEVLRRFARLHYAQGDYKTSESVSRQALGEELSHQARRRPELAAHVATLCAGLADGSKPAPWLDSFEVLREVRGDGSYETAGWMNGIALLCIKQERRDVARQLVEGALRFHCRIWGDECPIRKRSLELLAGLQ
jgi:serine/threonine-protein kinase